MDKSTIKEGRGPDKFIISIILLSLFIVLGGVFLIARMESSSEITASGEVRAKLSENTYSWGKIPINGGNVEKTFTIKNTGTETLKLTNIKTSCTCTKAQLKTKDKTSPFFGMHSKSSWVGEVNPKEEAEVVVVFDPAYHGPSGVGPITRHVVLETNDKDNSKITLTLTANVVNK